MVRKNLTLGPDYQKNIGNNVAKTEFTAVFLVVGGLSGLLLLGPNPEPVEQEVAVLDRLPQPAAERFT